MTFQYDYQCEFLQFSLIFFKSIVNWNGKILKYVSFSQYRVFGSLQSFRQNQLNAVLPMLGDASVPTPQRDSRPTHSGRMSSRGASLSTTQLQDKPCLWCSILTATPKTSFKALMPSTEGPQITRLQPDTALPG